MEVMVACRRIIHDGSDASKPHLVVSTWTFCSLPLLAGIEDNCESGMKRDVCAFRLGTISVVRPLTSHDPALRYDSGANCSLRREKR
jgi:hypothetical protein